MEDTLYSRAQEIIGILENMQEVRKCTLYGSLANGTHDQFSDIDIEVDVSGCDNGRFMLGLAAHLGRQVPVYYSDYAPSLIPKQYIVSIAIDESNPFLVVDLCCTADPHRTTVTAQQAKAQNDPFTHMLKLWTANLKHYLRGGDCHGDILRMVRKIGLDPSSTDAELLEQTLIWLEACAPENLRTFVCSCRRHFEINVKKARCE